METVDATESDSLAMEDVGTAESAPADVNDAEDVAEGGIDAPEAGIDAPSECPDSSAGRGCAHDTQCGALSRCAGKAPSDADVCCGAGNACCSMDTDCCSSECFQGVCTSAYNPCSTDADCNDGESCLARVRGGRTICIKLRGSACVRPVECASYQCTGGQCACTQGGGGPCKSDSDCCSVHEHCTDGLCSLAGEGAACTTSADCAQGACMNGQCRCFPAGTMTPPGTYGNGCCSDSWSSTLGCTASGGGISPCSPSLPDCFGGTCTSGYCACVGSGGSCQKDADCCAGTTRCVQSMCQ